jgi:hypothetical protein
MDRRKLIVGGGAAAVATTLSAVTGLPAQAAFTPASTADHVRRVLAEVNIDRGLVNPDGLRRMLERGYAEVVAAPPWDPSANNLAAWVRQRLVEVCRTETFAPAVTEIAESRALLAFSYLAYSQNQEIALPRLDPGIRVPAVLQRLEPDFFPVLVDQVTAKAGQSREFAYALQATSDELDRFLAEKVRESSSDEAGQGRGAQSKPGSGAEGLEFTAGILVILATVYWIKRGLTKD